MEYLKKVLIKGICVSSLSLFSICSYTQTWQSVQVGNYEDWSPLVQIDEDGYVHFGNQDELSTTRAQDPNNASGILTHFPTTVPSGYDEYFPALAVRERVPHLVYRTFTNNFKVAYWNPEMNAPQLFMEPGYHGHYPAIQVSSDQTAHIFYQMDQASDFGNIFYENTKNSDRQSLMPDGYDGAATLYSYATAIDRNDQLHWIGSFYGYEGGHGKNLYYNKTTQGVFDPVPELMNGYDGYFPSLEVDKNGVVHAVWELNDIYYSTLDAGGWSEPVMISTSSGFSEYYYVYNSLGNLPYNAIKPDPNNSQRAWAVGGYGIYRTENSWDHCQIQYINNTTEINGLFPVDSVNLFCVGNLGKFWYTHNGGVDEGWSEGSTHVSVDLNDCWFLDVSTGYAVGNDGTIIKTSDAGDNWETVSSGTTEDLYSIGFSGQDTGYIAAGSGTVLHTYNGGDSWMVVSIGNTHTLNDIHVHTKDTVWVAGSNAEVSVSYDAGNTWNSKNSGISSWISDLYGLYFIDKNTGYAVGSLNTADNSFYMCKTKDGGNSWVGTKSTNGNGWGLSELTDVYAIDENAVFITGPEGHIFNGHMQSNSRYHKPGIALDQNGYAHVTYCTATEPFDAIYYVNNVGGTWNSQQTVSGGVYLEQIDGSSRIGLDFTTNTIYIGARTSGEASYLYYSRDVNLRSPVDNDETTQVTASAALVEPGAITYSAKDSLNALQVLDFTIADVAQDGLPTYITQLNLWKGAQATPLVDYANSLASAFLQWNGTTLSKHSIERDKIQFGDGNSTIATIPEGESVTFTLHIWLDSLGSIKDGDLLDFKINGAHDVYIDTSGSYMSTDPTDITSGGIQMTLQPTKFIFTDLPPGIIPNSNYTFASSFKVSIANEYGLICQNSYSTDLSLTVTAKDSVSSILGAYTITPSGTQFTTNGSADYTEILFTEGQQYVRLKAEGTVDGSTITSYSDPIPIFPVNNQAVLVNDPDCDDPHLGTSLGRLDSEVDIINACGNVTGTLPETFLMNYDMVWVDEKDAIAGDSVAIRYYLSHATESDKKGIAIFGAKTYGMMGFYYQTGSISSYFGPGPHQIYPDFRFIEKEDRIFGVPNNVISDALNVACNGNEYPGNLMLQMFPGTDSTNVQVVFEAGMEGIESYPVPVALAHTGNHYKAFRTGFFIDEYGTPQDIDTLVGRLAGWFDSPYVNTLGHTPYFTNSLNMSPYDVTTVNQNEFFEYTAYCADADGDISNIVPAVLPSWMSYEANGDQIRVFGTPGEMNGGDTILVLKVYDEENNYMTQLSRINVFYVNRNPVIEGPMMDTAYVGQEFSLQLKVYDPDSLMGDRVDYLDMFPSKNWIQMDENGKLYGTPGIGDVGATDVFIQALDLNFGMGMHNLTIEVIDISGPFISVSPDNLSFTLPAESSESSTVTISNTGDAPLHWDAGKTAAWLNLPVISGSVDPGSSGILDIEITTQGLTPGEYFDTLVVNSDAFNDPILFIPVRLEIPTLPDTPAIDLSVSLFSLTVTEGNSVNEILIVYNSGGGLLSWSADKDSEWVQLDSEYNQIPAGGSDTLFVLVDATNLAPGEYRDTIFITSNDSSQPDIAIPVYLTVESAVPVTEFVSTGSIKIYPNPAKEEVRIVMTDKGEYDIRILDLTGKIIHIQTKKQARFEGETHTIYIADLESGVYWIKISNKHIQYVTKLIKL